MNEKKKGKGAWMLWKEKQLFPNQPFQLLTTLIIKTKNQHQTKTITIITITIITITITITTTQPPQPPPPPKKNKQKNRVLHFLIPGLEYKSPSPPVSPPRKLSQRLDLKICKWCVLQIRILYLPEIEALPKMLSILGD